MKVSLKDFEDQAKREEKEKEKQWSNCIRERDFYQCSICGSEYKPSAHHIVVREIKYFKYDLDNGITLCPSHHKFCREISAHNNAIAFFLWLQKYRKEQMERLTAKIKTYYAQAEGFLL
jgi:hypothetical protein